MRPTAQEHKFAGGGEDKNIKKKKKKVKVEIQGDVYLAYMQVCMIKLFSHLNHSFFILKNGNNNFSSYFIEFEDQVR